MGRPEAAPSLVPKPKALSPVVSPASTAVLVRSSPHASGGHAESRYPSSPAVHQRPQVSYLLNISSLSSLVSASGSLLFPAHFHLLVNSSNHNNIHLSPTSDLGDDPSLPLLFGNLTACPCVSGFASYFLFTSSHF